MIFNNLLAGITEELDAVKPKLKIAEEQENMEGLETNEKALLKKEYKDLKAEMEVLQDGKKKHQYEKEMKEIRGKL